jgi:iron complex outermembrane recepter protein
LCRLLRGEQTLPCAASALRHEPQEGNDRAARQRGSAPNASAATDVREGTSPTHQLLLRSRLDLPWRLELDGFVRAVSQLPTFEPTLPGYWELDVRAGWQWAGALELALVGRNLLHDRHREFGSLVIPPVGTALERSLFAVVSFRH